MTLAPNGTGPVPAAHPPQQPRPYVNGPVVQVPLEQYHRLVRAATGSELSDTAHTDHRDRMSPAVVDPLQVGLSDIPPLRRKNFHFLLRK